MSSKIEHFSHRCQKGNVSASVCLPVGLFVNRIKRKAFKQVSRNLVGLWTNAMKRLYQILGSTLPKVASDWWPMATLNFCYKLIIHRHRVSKNCAKSFLSEHHQISTNFDNFWQKDGREAKIMRCALIFHLI